MITEEEKEDLKERFRKSLIEMHEKLSTPKELCSICFYWTEKDGPHCMCGSQFALDYLLKDAEDCRSKIFWLDFKIGEENEAE